MCARGVRKRVIHHRDRKDRFLRIRFPRAPERTRFSFALPNTATTTIFDGRPRVSYFIDCARLNLVAFGGSVHHQMQYILIDQFTLLYALYTRPLVDSIILWDNSVSTPFAVTVSVCIDRAVAVSKYH